jgi:hypothetical protein
MKRLHNEADRARRYSQALVTASLAVRRAATWPESTSAAPSAVPQRWQERLSLTAGPTLAPPHAVEA